MGKKDADPKNDSGVFLIFLSKNGTKFFESPTF
jgi:hypothetical protein